MTCPGKCFACDSDSEDDVGSTTSELIDSCAEQYPGSEGAVAWATSWRAVLTDKGMDLFEADHALLEVVKFHHGLPPGPALAQQVAPLLLTLHPNLAAKAFCAAPGGGIERERDQPRNEMSLQPPENKNIDAEAAFEGGACKG